MSLQKNWELKIPRPKKDWEKLLFGHKDGSALIASINGTNNNLHPDKREYKFAMAEVKYTHIFYVIKHFIGIQDRFD